ncbi:ATP-dependent RNA helicase dbp10 [Acarospora aff. strigata]|nr:ATP-dependent RNA helicase dbp10 [Acarospora aff. strigata]
MPHRAVSPAISENEVDISNALFATSNIDSDLEDGGAQQHPDRRARMLDPGAILDLATESQEEADEDGAFIAAQQAASNRKSSNIKGRSVKRGGGFQAMGLNANLLKAITRKGFSVPTPIQRRTIPLVLDGQDVVGMARTGSGKTAAFVVPMIEKLKAHSAKVGARALILSPSRELALQTLKVVKELGRGTDLKCVLLVGGDSLEEQFGLMSANPDIVIATPGRFLHLKVEMGLDLSSIRYVVFDEADRLFEMGFAAQLTEILHALPQSRQTLLFSATLPKSLVEFARAGLQEPNLVRLDAESKISPDLKSVFFTVKSADKEGALLHILQDVIKIPTGQTDASSKAKENAEKSSKKRKRDAAGHHTIKPNESPTVHSTIVFAATKHHVDYLATLLRLSGFAVSHAYGSLDQTARKIQVEDFRTGMTNILVVTDVAARGIDIPVLANVINYDFPAQPKIFVHRVGRTARAGQSGWSYSLVRDSDAPYLLDLQLFLGRRLVLGNQADKNVNYTEDVVVGSLVRDKLERSSEWVTKMLDEDSDLAALRVVASKGEKLYIRTRNSASSESAKRSKEVVTSKDWMALHPLFKDDTDLLEAEREKMLARVSGFRPQETVFEIGKKGSTGEAAEIMRRRREKIDRMRREKRENQQKAEEQAPRLGLRPAADPESDDADGVGNSHEVNMDSASEEELEITFTQSTRSKDKTKAQSWRDSEHYMSYTPASTNLAEDRGYGVHSGSYNTASQNSNFVEAARGVTMDLNNDDGAKAFTEPSRARGMRWDKKNKKYVAKANDEDGSKGAKMIRGESGQKIAASFRSGRFDAWRKTNKIARLPRTGEMESNTAANRGGVGGRRFKHKSEKAPKEADRFRDDFYKKKRLVEAAKEKRIGRYKDGKGKSEIRGVDDVRKDRGVKEKRRDKNARPVKRRKA